MLEKNCRFMQNGGKWQCESLVGTNINVGSVLERLKRCAYDQRGLGSKRTHAVLLCLWGRHFTALFPAW